MFLPVPAPPRQPQDLGPDPGGVTLRPVEGLFDATAVNRTRRYAERRVPRTRCGHARRQPARLGPARGADAARDARGPRRAGAAAGTGVAAATPRRGRPADVAAAVGAAGHRQDHDREHPQQADPACLRRGLGGHRGRQGGPRGHRRGAPPAGDVGRGDGAVRRRGAPLHQGPAGRAAAGGREPVGDAGRRHHGEPVLQRDLAVAVTLAAAHPDLADRRRRPWRRDEGGLRRTRSRRAGDAWRTRRSTTSCAWPAGTPAGP